jgi:hypothetical protein
LGPARDRFCRRRPGSGYCQRSQHTAQKIDQRADEDADWSTWSSSRNRLGWPCQARQLDALLKHHLQAGCQCLLLEQCPLLAVLRDLTSEGLDLDETLCCRRECCGEDTRALADLGRLKEAAGGTYGTRARERAGSAAAATMLRRT